MSATQIPIHELLKISKLLRRILLTKRKCLHNQIITDYADTLEADLNGFIKVMKEIPASSRKSVIASEHIKEFQKAVELLESLNAESAFPFMARKKIENISTEITENMKAIKKFDENEDDKK